MIAAAHRLVGFTPRDQASHAQFLFRHRILGEDPDREAHSSKREQPTHAGEDTFGHRPRSIMRLEYPAKILLAWGEAISGNREIRDWLIKHGYPELGIFTFALRNKHEAREWLMKNGHPHLMAVITGIEGDEKALQWLDDHEMHVLRKVALTGDGDTDSFRWLVDHGHRELAMIGTKMNRVKRDLDEKYGDIHHYPTE